MTKSSVIIPSHTINSKWNQIRPIPVNFRFIKGLLYSNKPPLTLTPLQKIHFE